MYKHTYMDPDVYEMFLYIYIYIYANFLYYSNSLLSSKALILKLYFKQIFFRTLLLLCCPLPSYGAVTVSVFITISPGTWLENILVDL